MRQHFFTDPEVAARFAVERGTETDVYVGVLPRAEQGGGKDSLAETGRWLWAECDTETAIIRALDWGCPPPLIVRSSVGKGHCYWPLDRPLPVELIERGNRRLAFYLGADMRATDRARILRVAGTRNHKYAKPQRVAITRFETTIKNYRPGAIVGDLPDPTPPRPIPTVAPKRGGRPDSTRERLLEIPARRYVWGLTGRDVRHDMVQCPFHGGGEERTPSLHVGGPNATLYHCFGCDEGGDIFTFAARLWGMDEKREFPKIKDKLGKALP